MRPTNSRQKLISRREIPTHVHNATRQHKEWDCQQRKITGGIVALLRRQHQRGSAVSQVGHNGRKGHGKRNGRSQEHRHQEQSQQHD